MILSSIFLLATLAIYTAYSEKLVVDNYSRLMRHFTFNLFFAFSILSVNQLVLLIHVPFLCGFLGIACVIFQ